jgi:nucleotide-binding universal stress UspA family protein
MRTIENILCPIDVERPSNAALRYSFFLAEAFYASLDVVHARGTPDLLEDPRFSSVSPRYPKSENLMRELGTLLRAVTTSVPGRAAAHVVEGGALSAILRSALRFQSDLIVVGSRFEASPTWLFGSNVGEQLAYAAACPVLSVPERAPPSALRVRRILLPVASGRSATLLVQWTAAFARRFGATVELLNVHRDPGPHSGAEHPGAAFEELREMLRVAGIGVENGGSVRGGAFEGILERMESGGCDLVVMAAEPRGKRMSVTQPGLTATICRHALIPVLSVRGADSGSAVARLGSADRNAAWSSDESRVSA